MVREVAIRRGFLSPEEEIIIERVSRNGSKKVEDFFSSGWKLSSSSSSSSASSVVINVIPTMPRLPVSSSHENTLLTDSFPVLYSEKCSGE